MILKFTWECREVGRVTAFLEKEEEDGRLGFFECALMMKLLCEDGFCWGVGYTYR